MSVWKHPCYKDEVLSALLPYTNPDSHNAPFMRSVMDFTVGEFGDFRVPAGLRPGPFYDSYRKFPRLLLELYTRKRVPLAAAANRLFLKLEPAMYGLHGIYQFVADNWRNIFEIPVTKDYALHAELVKEVHRIGNNASFGTPAVSEYVAAVSSAALKTFIAPGNSFMRDFYTCIAYGVGKKYRSDCMQAVVDEKVLPEIDTVGVKLLNFYDFWQVGSTSILRTAKGVAAGAKVYAFCRSDVDRLDKLIRGISAVKYHFAMYALHDAKANQSVIGASNLYLKCLRDAMKICTKVTADSLCRAADVAYYMHMAKMAADLSDRSIRDQQAKIARENLGPLLDYKRIEDAVRSLGMKEQLEVLLIYKVLPQPDFDYFGAMHRQRALYETKIEHKRVEAEGKHGTVDDIFLYFKWTLMRAYREAHGKLPGHLRAGIEEKAWHAGYPDVKITNVPFRDVGDVDMAGCFGGNYRGSDVLDLVKDKAICPSNIQGISTNLEIAKLDVKHKNQLCDVLMSGREFNLMEMRERQDTLCNLVRLDDKAEAKKPNQRMFMEAHTDIRLIHSEREENLSNYALNVAGCMAGKKPRDKLHAIHKICETDVAAMAAGYEKMLISFDIEKFSPNFEAAYHARMDAILAEAFGQIDWADDYKIFTDGELHYVKGNIHHSMKKPGRDFEGFCGRKNTIWHCAVMGYAVHRIRTAGITDRPARFAALIDDGLLRLDIPVERLRDSVAIVSEILDGVYALGCMKISWDKTFISQRFSVFLNDIRVAGASIKPGIRAFLRMNNTPEQAAYSALDCIAQAVSGARGARMAGCYLETVWGYLSWLYVDIIKKYVGRRGRVPGNSGIMLYVPVAFGGFGAVPPLLVDVTAASDPVSDGLAVLRATAHRWPAYVTVINRILDVPIREKTPIDKLRAPLTFRKVGSTLQSSRLAAAVASVLEATVPVTRLAALLRTDRLVRADSLIAHVAGLAVLNVQTVRLLWETTFEHAMETLAAKFLRSATAMKMLGIRKLVTVSLKNMNEAKSVIRAWL